jgi:RNA ligase
LDALLEQVPDEFDAWVRGVVARLDREATTLAGEIESAYWKISHLGQERGEFARAAQSAEPSIRAALFLRLDQRPTDLHVWRAIKPGPSAPFKDDEEG